MGDTVGTGTVGRSSHVNNPARREPCAGQVSEIPYSRHYTMTITRSTSNHDGRRDVETYQPEPPDTPSSDVLTFENGPLSRFFPAVFSRAKSTALKKSTTVPALGRGQKLPTKSSGGEGASY